MRLLQLFYNGCADGTFLKTEEEWYCFPKMTNSRHLLVWPRVVIQEEDFFYQNNNINSPSVDSCTCMINFK